MKRTCPRHYNAGSKANNFNWSVAASFPEHPTFPNSLQFAGGGFGGGLVLGLALALLLEFRDKSLRTESDVEALLKLPILAMVPVMDKTKRGARIIFQARGETPSLPAKT